MKKNSLNIFSIVIIFILVCFLIIFLNILLNSKNFTPVKTSPKSSLSLEEVYKLSNSSLCSQVEVKYQQLCLEHFQTCKDDSCYYTQARSLGNLSLCYNISNENLKTTCLSALSIDKTIQGAVLQDNISLCDSLVQGSDACRNNYYYVKSVNSHNNSYCNFISVEEVKNECFQN